MCQKEKGITSMSVKDVLQSLVDDGMVDTDKIGTSVYFWAFPSKASQNVRFDYFEYTYIFELSIVPRGNYRLFLAQRKLTTALPVLEWFFNIKLFRLHKFVRISARIARVQGAPTSPFLHMTLIWNPNSQHSSQKQFWAEAAWPPLLLEQFEHWWKYL